MSTKNTEGLRKHNEQLQKEASTRTINAINKLKKNGTFTLAELCREANVSRAYLHKNPEMLTLARRYMKPGSKCKTRNDDTQEILIMRQKQEIKKLNAKIEKLNKEKESEESYKEKYEKALTKINELEEAMKELYTRLL